MKDVIKLIANNKKAYHDYFIDDKFETGIELYGTEVKSIRMENAASKKHLSGFRTARSIFMECTSIPMKRAIFSTKILCARKL